MCKTHCTILFLVLPFFTTGKSHPNLGTRIQNDMRQNVVLPKLKQFHITSKIQFRYAQTVVTSLYENCNNETSQQVHFSVNIPDSAFISNFSMVIDDSEYVAQVKVKHEAEKLYNVSVESGLGAGLVTQRSSNKFRFSANLEPGKTVQFKLIYEQLLQRKLGKYRHFINVNPGQVVHDFKIKVFIDESLPLLSLKVPELKQSNDIDFKPNQESKIAVIERNVNGNPCRASIKFEPSQDYQLEAGEQGVEGQLEVQYDVDREGQHSHIQVIDGYFVHYFTPENLPTLPKYTVFVLDVSGSMFGEKMEQLKDAMFTILDDMNQADFFNILTFSTGVTQWILPRRDIKGNNLTSIQATRTSIQANKQNRDEAIKYIISLAASGMTNINDALLESLDTITRVKINEELPTHVSPQIVFLTDGLPSSSVTSRDVISSNVNKANQALKVPIYSLGFGRDADFNLIKQISEEAKAFSRHIYEGSDAALQLEDFFSQIASPVLANVRFDYVGGTGDNSSITKVTDATVDTMFKGGEYIIAGQVNNTDGGEMQLMIIGDGENGGKFQENIKICLRESNNASYIQSSAYMIRNPSMIPCSLLPSAGLPARSEAENFLQKLHAFLNIKQLLNKPHTRTINSSQETPRDKATRIAIQNNFVTELTSLVVVQPHDEPKIVEKIESNVHPTYNRGIQLSNSYIPTAGRSYTGRSRSSSKYGGVTRQSSRGRGSSSRAGSRGYGGRTSRRRNSFPAYDSTGFSVMSAPGPRRPQWTRQNAAVAPPLSTTAVAPPLSTTAVAPPLSTTEAPPNNHNCSITLFAKTYFRGDSVVISSNTDNFRTINFDNKLVSMKVSGPCCWSLYTLKLFGGTEKTFSEGNFSSVTSVGPLFRQASSTKQISC